MEQFRWMKTLQKFAAVHGPAHNHFRRYRTSLRLAPISWSAPARSERPG